MLSTPVVLIAFNRPHLVRRALAAIRDARPSELYLVADGPRADHPEDAQLCREVRAELEDIDWPCEVHCRFSDVNLGCEANVELGLDWVFEQVESAIILEDDCIADPSFFPYCEELLQRYAADDRVWHVAGNRAWVPTELFEGDSYRFSAWASVWGWATWRDAWQRHRELFPRDHGNGPGSTSAPMRSVPPALSRSNLVTNGGHRHFTDVVGSAGGVVYGWDSHWWVTLLSEEKLSVTPSINMVMNDGYGEGATHTRSSRKPPPAEPMSFPLSHPAQVVMSRPVELELELTLVRSTGRLARAARRVIRPLWMRELVRRMVHGRSASGTLRMLFRLSAGVRRLRPGASS